MRAPHTTTKARTIHRVFTFRVSLHTFALALGLTGCPRAEAVRDAPDASVVSDGVLDAGVLVTEARLDAWLTWQRGLAQGPVFDGGDALRRRARAELAALADAGLTVTQVGSDTLVISFEDADLARDFGRRVSSKGYNATSPVATTGRYWNVEVKNG
jgi:hypothetical protein